MATRPEDSLAKMVAALKETTGKSLDEWRAVINAAGLQKHGEIVTHLKAEYGISHGYANQIALRRNDTPADTDPVDTIFANRPLALGLYQELVKRIQAFGDDVDIAPKKANVSIRRKKQFALLQPAADRLDVGINLPGLEPTNRLEASGSFNAMFSHRVRVRSAESIDDELMCWLKRAYDAA